MINWRTNLGGAFGALGTALVGIGVLPQLTPGNHSVIFWWVAFAGFILSALGKFFTALFAADAKALQDVSDRVDTTAHAVVSGDTTMLPRAVAPPAVLVQPPQMVWPAQPAAPVIPAKPQ